MANKQDPRKVQLIEEQVDPMLSGSRTGAMKRTRVMREYFLRHPGIQVWLIDLREAQQAEDCYDGDQKIITAINNTRANKIMNIETVVHGQAWIYRPGVEITDDKPAAHSNGRVSERLYREKMVTKGGDRIIEDEDGVLFRAKELDL